VITSRSSLAIAVLALLPLASGCGIASSAPDAPSTASSTSSSTSIPVGPGPQQTYTVQPQPAAGSCHYKYTADQQPLPDPGCTPGALSPAVTQATLSATICGSGYTSGIRPPVSITDPEKRNNAASYSYTDSLHDAEYDHLVSLELGGDPNDSRNLWVEPPSPGHQPGAGPNNPKDKAENDLHAAVCDGKAQLAAAQNAIATDWTTAEHVLGLN